MSYIACSICGNLNRDSDSNCYSCGQELVAPPPPPPETVAPPVEDDPWAANKDLRVQPLSPSAGGDPSKARFKDLASRYEAKAIPKLDANVLHGIRAGVPAGLITGVLMGLYRKQRPDDFTRILVRKYPSMKKSPDQIFGYSIGFDLFLGLILGIILGLTNLLCFTPEASRTGAIVGALVGGGLVYLAGTGFAGIVLGAVHGLILGGLTSLIERKVFRRA